MEYHVRYVESRKNFEGRRGKKFIWQVPKINTQETIIFAECNTTIHSANSLTLPCISNEHSVKF